MEAALRFVGGNQDLLFSGKLIQMNDHTAAAIEYFVTSSFDAA